MSTNMQEMLSVLSEAHEAVKLLPELRSKIADLEYIGKGNADRINAQESTIDARDATIAELNARIRSLEVERDNAMFREAETSDKLNHAMVTLNNIIGRAQDFKAAIEPEPVAPVEASPEPVGQSAENPTEHTSEPSNTTDAGTAPGAGESGRSAVDPMDPTPPSPEANDGGSTQSDTTADTGLSSGGDSSPLPESPSHSPTPPTDTSPGSAEATYNDYLSGKAAFDYFDTGRNAWRYKWKSPSVAA